MDSNLTQVLVNYYGGVGILAVVALIGVRYLFKQVQEDKKRETQRADRNEAALAELNKQIQGQFISVLTETVGALRETNRVIPEIQAELRVKRERD